MARKSAYWLVKSEPECYSIRDLANSLNQTTCWDGVRNYQARNFMRDQMHLGDRVLFYHSSADPPAVAGTAVVVREAYPDHTAWNPKSDHYDPQASADNPIWQMVDIRLEEIFPEPIPLDRLRGVPALKGMELLRKGSRLSVQPVTQQQFDTVVSMAQTATRSAPRASSSRASAAKRSRRSVNARLKAVSKKTVSARARRAAR